MPDTNGLRVWQTEYAYLGNAYETTWYSNGGEDEGLYWANQIYQGIVTCELSAFLQWWGEYSRTSTSQFIRTPRITLANSITRQDPVPTPTPAA